MSAPEAAAGPAPRESGAARSNASLPERIELGAKRRRLSLRWPDGLEATLGATTLRNACRCATCTQAGRRAAPLETDAGISLDEVVEFGVAGLQLVFSDGHRRGIFPWEYLRQLAAKAP